MRVLVADDSGLIRRILTGMLQQECGIKDVVHAPDGAKAEAFWKDEEFDLILLDWNMPKQSGIETLRAIRSVDAQIPVIMVTSEKEKHRVVEAVKAGASDYIIKPFTPKTVGEKIRRVLINKVSA